VNIAGLAVGMAVSVLILNYVFFEFSYDKMHSKKTEYSGLKAVFMKVMFLQMIGQQALSDMEVQLPKSCLVLRILFG
jgi:hypothetical protein